MRRSDYALNQESLSGSLAQLSTAIQEYRTENTLLMDAGDTIQDNSAEIFLSGDDVHPMVQAINALNYDVWVTGNHDYNYGMEITKKTIADLDCKVLTGNVYDKKGERIADGCTVLTVDGVRIAGQDIHGTLVVQNKDMGQTMSVIDLILEKDVDGWKLTDKSSGCIDIAAYQPDPVIMDLLEKYDTQAKIDAETVIGKLEGGPLVPGNGNNGNAADTAVSENVSSTIPVARIRNTPLMDLVNRVQMYYADAAVSAVPLSFAEANLYPGNIRKCDVSMIYKFNNTLYKVHMNGGQLKKYMERSAVFFNTFHPGDSVISINSDMPDYLYHMFEGVNYEINISREPGNRVENLTWPDGTPVQEDDEFELAINNYSAVSELLAPGVIYEDGELPRLVDIDIRGDIGGLRELIRDYIVNVKGGTIKPEVNENWRITGIGKVNVRH